MTKKEREYLQEQVKRNQRIIKEVEAGELWGDIFETQEQKLAFIQGIAYVNDVIDALVNTEKAQPASRA